MPVTESPWPGSASTVAPMLVKTLVSPLRRGDRTNTSRRSCPVSSHTSVMPAMLPGGGVLAHRSEVRDLGSDPGPIRHSSETASTDRLRFVSIQCRAGLDRHVSVTGSLIDDLSDTTET
jgi:hypothetical protein